MKTIVYKIEVSRNNDNFSYWFFNSTDAEKEIKNLLNHMTEKEKLASAMMLTSYAISLHNYAKSAEQLMQDLFNEEMVIPEYDSLLEGFIDSSIISTEDLI